MIHSNFFFGGLFAMAAALLLSAEVAANPSNKWRLQFSGGADSDGTLVLRILPVDGDPIETSTAIAKGTGENRVAKTVVKSLKEQLPKDVYHIERDDGEDVLIKRRWGESKFDVEIVSLDVKGVRINKDRE